MKQMKSNIEIMSPEEIELIHKSALRVLAETGFHVPNKICLQRAEKAGGKVDYNKQIVRLPSELTEDHINDMRRSASWKSEHTPKLSGGISTQVFVTDYTSRKRRYGLTDDIMKGIALVKHLKNIPHSNAVTIPSDIDARITDLYSYNLLLKYSEKPGGTYILSKETAKYIMQMSEIMGRKAFYLFESVSPLRFRKETLEMGLLFADQGHYLGIAPMIMGGMSGPITLAGTLTLIVAEVLASMFMVYALTGELSTFFGHGSHTNDPKSMICSFGSPNQALIAIGTAQMAKYYGLPSGSNSALSDALMPDFQCGFEKTLSALLGGLSGQESIGCQGIAGADQGFSFEQLVLDNEWLDAYNYVVSGFEVSEETIAVDLINSIGIGGNFIAEEHTVEYLRKSWWPSNIFTRDDFDVWQNKGGTDVLQRAHSLVEELTAGYQSIEPVVTEDTVESLDRILAEASKEIIG